MRLWQNPRLDYALVSPNLIDKLSKIEHCFTNASDHATISIEISTDMERQGQGTFRAPPYIQNDPKYVKLAEEVIIETQLNCKKDENLVNTYRKLINNRREKENSINMLTDFKFTYTKIYGISNYLKELDKAREDLAILMSLEPTAEDINKMESSCEKKSTEIEMILMELKLLTTRYAKDL